MRAVRKVMTVSILTLLSTAAYALSGAELTTADSGNASSQVEINQDLKQNIAGCWNSGTSKDLSIVIQDLKKDTSTAYKTLTSETQLTMYVERKGQINSNKCSVNLRIPVKTINETCNGVNTLGFLFNGRSSFAAGKVVNAEGSPLSSLFAIYQGRADGLGLVAGTAKWQAKSSQGIQIKDSMKALPLPAVGGNFALGYTACDLEYALAPASENAELNLIMCSQDYKNCERQKLNIPLLQIQDMAL